MMVIGYAIEEAAKRAHEANRVYCESLGDETQLPWHEAPEWQRESAVAGVRSLLRSPAMSPKQQHAAWCESKRRAGWKYGDRKDAEQKTHPCLVEYAQLPEDQRMKDIIFQAVVRSTLDETLPGWR